MDAWCKLCLAGASCSVAVSYVVLQTNRVQELEPNDTLSLRGCCTPGRISLSFAAIGLTVTSLNFARSHWRMCACLATYSAAVHLIPRELRSEETTEEGTPDNHSDSARQKALKLAQKLPQLTLSSAMISTALNSPIDSICWSCASFWFAAPLAVDVIHKVRRNRSLLAPMLGSELQSARLRLETGLPALQQTVAENIRNLWEQSRLGEHASSRELQHRLGGEVLLQCVIQCVIDSVLPMPTPFTSQLCDAVRTSVPADLLESLWANQGPKQSDAEVYFTCDQVVAHIDSHLTVLVGVVDQGLGHLSEKPEIVWDAAEMVPGYMQRVVQWAERRYHMMIGSSLWAPDAVLIQRCDDLESAVQLLQQQVADAGIVTKH